MENTTKMTGDNLESSDYVIDFMTLSSREKRFIFDTANNLMGIQNDNAVMLADSTTSNEKKTV